MTEILNEFESNSSDTLNNNSQQSQATIHQLNQTDEPGNKQSPPARTSGAKGKVLFKNSPVAKFEDFKAAFVNSPYQDADLEYYHEVISNWSEGGGKRKNNWVATAKSWMLRDRKEGKLITLKTNHHGTGKKTENPFFSLEQSKRVYERLVAKHSKENLY